MTTRFGETKIDQLNKKIDRLESKIDEIIEIVKTINIRPDSRTYINRCDSSKQWNSTDHY